MSKKSIFSFVVLFYYALSNGQCNIDFTGLSFTDRYTGSGSGTDIELALNNGTPSLLSYSFNLNSWDETNNDCLNPGGVDDVTVTIEMIQTYDVYGGSILDLTAPNTHEVRFSGTLGFQGDIPMNNSGTRRTTNGDVRGYKVTVRFAPHVYIQASDMQVLLNSINTRGSVFESAAIEFLNPSGAKYGVAQYSGFYGSGSRPINVPSCPTGPVTGHSFVPTSNPWFRASGTKGTFFAQSTATVNINDICNPVAGTTGSNDVKSVDAVTDAGLAATDLIGGFVYTLLLEDVAGAPNDVTRTSTSANLTSSIRGFNLSAIPLSISISQFKAELKNNKAELTWLSEPNSNTKEFEIIKSNDQIHWQTMHKIQAYNSVTKYQWTDEFLVDKSINYYQIKSIGFDGETAVSNIVKINLNNHDLTVFPNPVNDVVNVSIQRDEIDFLNLTDALGKSVMDLINIQEDGIVKLDLSQLTSGVYYLYINKQVHQLVKP